MMTRHIIAFLRNFLFLAIKHAEGHLLQRSVRDNNVLLSRLWPSDCQIIPTILLPLMFPKYSRLMSVVGTFNVQ